MGPEKTSREQAYRRFGNLALAGERTRDVDSFRWMRDLAQDLRYALRQMRRSPGFTFVAIATLALGIGANTAMYSVVRGVLLDPLPYRDPARLVLVRATASVAGTRRAVPISVSDQFLAWREARTLELPAFYTTGVEALSGDHGRELIDTAVVSPEFFETLAGPIATGRGLGRGDGSTSVIVISDRLARRLFVSPVNALGRSLTLTSTSCTIVGVADPRFQFPVARTDVWMLQTVGHNLDAGFQLVARLRAAATLETAAAEADSIAGASVTRFQQVHASTSRLADDLTASATRPLAILFAAVLLVLIVACVNLANLILARHASRWREFATRVALGASRGRLAAQLLTETAVLALFGTSVGLVVANIILAVVTRVDDTGIPRLGTIRLDISSVIFAGAVGAGTTLVAGVAPATLLARSIQGIGVRAGMAATRPHERLRRVLCTAEWAIAFVLLVGATLLGRSLVRLMRTDLGVSTDHVVTASLNLAFGERPTDAETISRVDRIIDRVRTTPGVRAAGMGTSLPPDTSRLQLTLRRAGEGIDYAAAGIPVTPGYFSALHVPLLKGRLFTDTDDTEHPEVMIMSEATARRFFGVENPIGQLMTVPTLRNGRQGPVSAQLVGVIGNVKYSGLTAPSDDAVYRPFAQQTYDAPFLVARTVGEPTTLVETIRREIARADPEVVVSSVRTFDELLSSVTVQPRLQAVVLASLAGLGLIVAAVGLYGVVAFSVAQRTSEIGVRMALGATTRDILNMVLVEGALMSVIGVTLGAASAIVLSRALVSLLYGVTPTDIASYGLTAGVLFVVALLASYIPARRATKVDPLVALRCD